MTIAIIFCPLLYVNTLPALLRSADSATTTSVFSVSPSGPPGPGALVLLVLVLWSPIVFPLVLWLVLLLCLPRLRRPHPSTACCMRMMWRWLGLLAKLPSTSFLGLLQ
ncbi:hypothetical protein G6F52_013349 [Rhizopus delemar]|nr:hypothetical protein G6F52_013349 [Rhizopus delemar]